ncbi:hypothetical protein P152DRAFT_483017 [Eremomyces bilateralis CBS 781.70]|uniref:Uncharacterized protein n=1 Tax=Eremomyces bilateralis CBS 781.70 TaxID=1392243 RepID=A0A6G1G0C7_9PEZI|nr:uncharacterized protein P152DRAFT_483017 [Eremomyces bilateralis CBS 781.70]KAF1811567.1 hypothetical protein P152DRAFT_483017 [Eremomyces bilateralis CBS 781.70]
MPEPDCRGSAPPSNVNTSNRLSLRPPTAKPLFTTPVPRQSRHRRRPTAKTRSTVHPTPQRRDQLCIPRSHSRERIDKAAINGARPQPSPESTALDLIVSRPSPPVGRYQQSLHRPEKPRSTAPRPKTVTDEAL